MVWNKRQGKYNRLFEKYLQPNPATPLIKVDSEQRKKMRVLTYNIWFENITQDRIEDLIDVICDTDADIVCL